MIVVPLGVSSATPTANRHLPSIALWRDGRVFLFDCGENTQMQMLKIGIKRSKIDYIFISHLDGDHFYGLPGLISTLHIQRRERDLTIVGPVGVKDFIDFNLRFAEIELTFDIHYIELEEGFEGGTIIDEDEFYVDARPMIHNRFCLGYRFQEKSRPGKVNALKASDYGITDDEHFKALKEGYDVALPDGSVVEASEIVGPERHGKSFVYITDTRKCENAVILAKRATFLFHEATFGNSLSDKAQETLHSTAEEAAEVAKEADVDRLVLMHYSARYTNEFVLYKEARKIFENTWIAQELRPIMTDPKVESSIFRNKSRGDNRRSSGGRRFSGSRGGGGGGSRFKKRFKRGGSGGGYNDRGPSRGRGGYDNSYRSDSRGRGRSYGGGGYSDRDRNDSYSSRGHYDDRDRDRGGYNRDRGYDNSSSPRNYDQQPPSRGGYDSERSRDPRYDPRRDSARDRINPKERSTRNVIKPRNNFDDYDRF